MQAPKDAAGEAFNIAYGGQVNLNELYQKLSELLNKKIEPVYGPERAGDIKHSNADIGKARKHLKYAPDYSFERGIELTIEWYREELL